MALNNNLPYRQSIRLCHHDYRQPGAYFITICTHNREPLFGEINGGRMHLNSAGNIVQTIWNVIPSHFPQVILDEFVVMPDHVHGILVLTDTVGALLAAPVNNENTATPDNQCNINAPENIRHVTGAASGAPTIGQIIRRFKSQTAITINRCLNRAMQPLWQRNYWERVIRDDDELQVIGRYIQNNPMRWQQK